MGIEASIDSPLAEAVRRAGSQSAFARIIGCSQGYVHELLRNQKPLPTGPVSTELNWVLKAEKQTGVSRHLLRPDLYPDETIPAEARLDRRPATIKPAAAPADTYDGAQT